MAAAGATVIGTDVAWPMLTEYNRPVPGRTLTRGGPVIYEGTFRAVGRS